MTEEEYINEVDYTEIQIERVYNLVYVLIIFIGAYIFVHFASQISPKI